MDSQTQTWLALAVVFVTAVLLGWSWWRRRGRHEGCNCPGAKAGRELRKFRR
jgi:hypothetical protein